MSVVQSYSPADVLARVLIALGVAADPDVFPLGQWPAYTDSEPNVPDDCLTCYDTTPQQDGRAMIDGESFKHYGAQVRIRSSDNPTGWLEAATIEEALNKRVYQMRIDIGSGPTKSFIVNNASAKSPLRLGKDTPATMRSLHTVNVMLSIMAL